MMIWKGIVPFFFIIPLMSCVYLLIFNLEFEIILAGVAITALLVYEFSILFSLYNKIDNDLENEKYMNHAPLQYSYPILIEDNGVIEINNDPGVQT
jgi:hypothetical protein